MPPASVLPPLLVVCHADASPLASQLAGSEFGLRQVRPEDLAQARAELDPARLSLILFDLEQVGPSDLQSIRLARHLWPCLPLLVVGAQDDEELAVTARRAGACDYLAREQLTRYWLLYLLRRRLTTGPEHSTNPPSGCFFPQRETASTPEGAWQPCLVSNRYFRLALQRAPITISQADRTGRYLWVFNPPPELAPAEFVGKRDDEILPDPSGTTLTRLKQKVMASDMNARQEIQVALADGPHTYDMALEPLHDTAGHVIGVTTVALDTTERQQTEDALHESEQRLRLALEAGRMGMWDWQEGGPLVWNRRMCEFFDLPPAGDATLVDVEEVRSRIHPDDLARIAPALDRARGEEVYEEFRVVLPDGQVRWLANRGQVLSSQGAPHRRIIGVCLDITATKQAAEDLHYAYQELSTTLERISDFFYSIDHRWRIVHLNQRIAELIGEPPEELVGRDFWEAFPHLRGTVFETQYRRAMAEQEPVHFEAKAIKVDLWYDVHVYPSQEGLSVFLHDISDRKRNEALQRQTQSDLKRQVAARTQELTEVNLRLQQEIEGHRQAEDTLRRMRQMFTLSSEKERVRLAHELHDGPMQDLSALSIELSLLADGMDEARVAGVVAIAQKLVQVNRSLRGLASELRPPVLASFGLIHALESLAQQFRTQYSYPQIKLVLPSEEEPLAEERRFALYRVCQQALRNVHQHAQAQQVSVRLGYMAGQVVLEVEDDGCGFEVPENWAHIVHQGHLGLIGMAERVDAVGGTFTVESQPGRGTRIRAMVPRGSY